MLTGDSGMAGAVSPLAGEEVDLPALQQQLVRLATEKPLLQGMVDAVAAAAENIDPAILAQKHDEAYRSALDESAPARATA